MNAKSKRLQKHYDLLEPAERWRLALAAAERGDEAEMSALGNTAPRAAYKMTAWPYRGMVDATQKIAWAFVTDILSNGIALMHGWAKALAHTDTSKAPDPAAAQAEEDSDPNWWQITTRAAEDIEAAWRGLGLFAEEEGVTRDQMLTHAPGGDMARIVVNRAELALGMAADWWYYLADHAGIPEAEGELLVKERLADAQERRDKMAAEARDLCRELWDRIVNEAD